MPAGLSAGDPHRLCDAWLPAFSFALSRDGLPTQGAALKQERVKGIEPSPKAWEAFVLPLNYTRVDRPKLAITDRWVKRRRNR